MLPHQVDFIDETLSLGRGARVVLADSVGLGKTTSLRALVAELDRETTRPARVLVVVSVTLGRQWVAMLSDDFGIEATTMDSQRMRSMEAVANPDQNLWLEGAKFVTSPQFLLHDERYRSLLAVPWDLVIAEDVVSRAGGSPETSMIADLWSCDRVVRFVASVTSPDILQSLEPSPDSVWARGMNDLRGWDGHLLYQRNEPVQDLAVSLTSEEADLLDAVRALTSSEASTDSVSVLQNRAASSLMALEQAIRRLLVVQERWHGGIRRAAESMGSDIDPVSELQGVTSATSDKLTKLLQLLENVPRDSKMAALVALVADAAQNPGPCIIFTDYRDTADYIVDQLQLAECARPIESVVADSTPQETAEAVRRTIEQNGALVATTDACMGFELGSAALVVHYDTPRAPAGMTIRMSRVDRITADPGARKVISLAN